MLICAAGDTHGAIDQLYHDILDFEDELGITFDHVLHVGDFGIWPDANRLDKATREHDGAGNFADWLSANRPVPRPTVFIKGNHEDFEWLEAQNSREILPGLTWLRNGETIDLEAEGVRLRVGGIGGCYGPRDFETPSRKLVGKGRSHYTKDECERLRACDILLLHDAPLGIEIVQQQRRYVSDADGLAEVVTRTRPGICFVGHHHEQVRADVAGVPCIGLNLVGRPGHLVAVEVGPGRVVKILGHGLSNMVEELTAQ